MGGFFILTTLYKIRMAKYSRLESLRSYPSCSLYGVIRVFNLKPNAYLTPAFASLCKRVLRADEES